MSTEGLLRVDVSANEVIKIFPDSCCGDTEWTRSQERSPALLPVRAAAAVKQYHYLSQLVCGQLMVSAAARSLFNWIPAMVTALLNDFQEFKV